MVTLYTDEGMAFAATVVSAAPNVVTQVKTAEKEGYDAMQIGAFDTKETRVNKAQFGHTKGKALKVFREMRPRPATMGGLPDTNFPEVGSTIDVGTFAVGDTVTVSAVSKGKGFQGGVKRWNFRTQDATHGNSVSHRVIGSTGQNQTPGRVFKGKKMPGHLGDDRVTVQGLEIVSIDAERSVLVVKGAIPGATGGDVIVRPTIKA